MLFLLAGYEIELKELTGRGGRRALATWVCCFLLALGFVAVLGLAGLVTAEVAVAIALVSTALGVLLPILRDSGQLSTPFGATILNHGAFSDRRGPERRGPETVDRPRQPGSRPGRRGRSVVATVRLLLRR